MLELHVGKHDPITQRGEWELSWEEPDSWMEKNGRGNKNRLGGTQPTCKEETDRGGKLKGCV